MAIISIQVNPRCYKCEVTSYYLTEGKVPVFVDCEIRTGMDAFKALALGAAGVCVGRPFMPIIKNEGAAAMAAHIRKLTDELKKAMSFTGCYRLDKMDASVIHKR